MTSLRPNVKAAIFLASLTIMLFAARAAFSYSRAEIEEIEASMSLPAFGLSPLDLAGDDSELSISDLGAVAVSANGSRSEAIFDEAPVWIDGQEKTEEAAPSSVQELRRIVVTDHIVKAGENLGSIASRNGVTVETVMSYNNLTKTVIRPGMKIQVPSKTGVRVKLRRGETPWDLSRRYGTKLADILEWNNISDARSLRAGQSLFLVGARPLKGKPGRAGRSGGGYVWPVKGGRLSSKFGFRKHPITRSVLFHRGIDLAAPRGSKIRAFHDGRVVFSGRRGGFGNLVEIRHDNGIITRYAHNQKNFVKNGQRVKAGEAIAAVGSSGHSTGPHVHFEVISKGKRQDPISYF